MKNLILTFALLVSTVAFGGDPDPSTPWSKLSRMHNIIFEMPQFAMSSGWFMRAPSVCVDGDKLRSKLPKQECISWSGRDNNDEYTSFYPSIAIEGTKERCVSWSDVITVMSGNSTITKFLQVTTFQFTKERVVAVMMTSWTTT